MDHSHHLEPSPNHSDDTGSQIEHHEHHSSMGHAGHDHGAMIKDFKKRFYIVLIITIPIMLLSPMIQHWLNVHWEFMGSNILLSILSSVVFFYGGWPFLKGWFIEMKDWKPGMMTLIGIAITVAYTYSLANVIGLKGMDFFWELSTLILIMLLGHWIEMRSIAGASKELELLVQLMPSDAHFIHGDHIMDVPTQNLKSNDIILVKPGEKVAADGLVLEGESYLNESMLTGESKPVEKKKGSTVIAGSLNGNGSLKVQVSHGAKDSYLSQVIKLVQDAPLVVAKSTALSAQKGLLIKNRTAFENSRRVTTIVFDKTGTLTIGKFEVSKVIPVSGKLSEKEIIRLASALEQSSEHPIATGILQKAKDLAIQIPSTENFKAITGKGVEAVVEGQNIKVVSPGYLKEEKISFPEELTRDEAETVVFVLIDNNLSGLISLADTLRPESKEAIQTLHSINIKSVLLTGDNKKVAEAVSKKVGIDSYFAEVLPHQKLEKIKELQEQGEYVAMTGDGVNDAPALAQANIGIAVGSGSDIAAETAGIVLVNSNPKDIVALIQFGKATYRKMIQNLIWATGYNLIALPLAAGVMYKSGILLSPAAGAVLMTVSTVVVAFNASLLKVK